MVKWLKLWMAVAVLQLGMVMTSWAGQWHQDGTGWWYSNDDGTYTAGGWQEIDGIYYYFGSDGYMLAGTTTPDGYQVGPDGAWLQPGDGLTYNENILMPWYVVDVIFNSNRSVLKYITLGCDSGCRIYYTTGVNPPDPTEEDSVYFEKRKWGLNYGSPSLKPGETLKAVAVKDGQKSGVTTLRYEDAVTANKGRSGNIAGSPAASAGVSSGQTSSADPASTAAQAAPAQRRCPVCAGQGTVMCTYCHGSGIGVNASIGLGGDVWEGNCPSCAGSGKKLCAGCGGSGWLY